MNTTEAYNSIKKILLALPEVERHTVLGRLSTTMKTHNSTAELLEKCRQSKVADDAVLVTDSHSAIGDMPRIMESIWSRYRQDGTAKGHSTSLVSIVITLACLT